MSEIVKVGICAGLGVAAGSFLEPKIVPHLPASLQTPTTAKLVHAAIAGGAAMLAYFVVRKVG